MYSSTLQFHAMKAIKQITATKYVKILHYIIIIILLRY